MKKTYFAPEMEVVELNVLQPILTGSLPLTDTTIEDPEEILAPGFNPGIPGLNGLDNEIFGF